MSKQTIETLLKSIKELPIIKQRCAAACIGACVSDAATKSLHWIYNQDTLNEILSSVENPEFYPENKCPFYSTPLGGTSCYNNILTCTLTFLNANNGKMDIDGLCNTFKEHFGDDSEYDEAYKARIIQYDAQDKSIYSVPVPGPWIQMGVRKMVEDLKKGLKLNDDSNEDYDGFLAALPLVLSHGIMPNLWENMREVILLLTTDEETIKFFHVDAILLEECILGTTDPFVGMKEKVKELYSDVMQKITDLESNQEKPFVSVVAKYGKACTLPGSFLGSYLAMISASSYVDAVRLNITAGGDNCSRANVIGACYGARYGVDAIPMDWILKVSNIEKIIEISLNIAKQ